MYVPVLWFDSNTTLRKRVFNVGASIRIWFVCRAEIIMECHLLVEVEVLAVRIARIGFIPVRIPTA